MFTQHTTARLSCRGTFTIEESTAKGPTGHLPDTFLTLKGWGKGVAYVNGFNLGWYWPSIGPQNNYFVPGPILREGPNEVILLEFERLKGDLTGWPRGCLSASNPVQLKLQLPSTATAAFYWDSSLSQPSFLPPMQCRWWRSRICEDLRHNVRQPAASCAPTSPLASRACMRHDVSSLHG